MTDYHFKKFLELVEPNVEFGTEIEPMKPDYSDFKNWAARPENDAQQFYVPDESFQVTKKDNDVDVFYIHPTGFYEKKWNNKRTRQPACIRTPRSGEPACIRPSEPQEAANLPASELCIKLMRWARCFKES